MRESWASVIPAALVALCLAASPAGSRAQGHGGGGGMGAGGGMGGNFPRGGPMGGGNPGIGNIPSPSPSDNRASTRGSVQLGPPGRWWDDKSFVKTLKLRPDQQARMDSIFGQNRGTLLIRYQTLQQAESQMDEILKAPALDESALFTQIDRIAQARAELEKANAHLVLQIRKEMDPDQLSRLEKR